MKKVSVMLLTTAAMVTILSTGVYAKPIVITNATGDMKNKINDIVQSKWQNGNFDSLKDICEDIGIDFDSIQNGDCPIINIPGIQFPNLKPELPDFNLPGINKPDNNLPDMEQPDNNLPDSNLPGIDKPDNNLPDIEKPENNYPTEDAFVSEVVRLVNIERNKEGLGSLKTNNKVTAAAQIRAQEQKQLFSHTRPNGSDFSTALKEQGVSFRGAGENIAWGQTTPQEVMNGWMNSPGHKANILNKNFTTIGVGHYKSQNVNYWSQLFTY